MLTLLFQKTFLPPNGFPVSSCILSQRIEVINWSNGVVISFNLGNAIWIWSVEASNTTKVHDGSLVMYLLELWCLLSYNSPPVNSILVINLICYPFLYDVFYTPTSWHVRIPHGCWFSNGVTISNLWYRDETEGLLWARTQGCAARHA
jgi:hypothetical protein